MHQDYLKDYVELKLLGQAWLIMNVKVPKGIRMLTPAQKEALFSQDSRSLSIKPLAGKWTA
jgi:hypothetical protein